MTKLDAEADETRKDDARTLEAVNEALAEKGEGRPAAEVHAELRKKYFTDPHPSRRKRRQAGPKDSATP
jgi:hypothetical protein